MTADVAIALLPLIGALWGFLMSLDE